MSRHCGWSRRPPLLAARDIRAYFIKQADYEHTLVKIAGQDFVKKLRTVPTFVTAHTFCASRDTRVSYGWCLLIQGYFGAV